MVLPDPNARRHDQMNACLVDDDDFKAEQKEQPSFLPVDMMTVAVRGQRIDTVLTRIGTTTLHSFRTD